MPRRDGTGPMGAGSMTGRGLGLCTGANTVRYGAGIGLGCRRGFAGGYGRGFVGNQVSAETQKEQLQEQKNFLQDQIKNIENQLQKL